MAGVANGMNPRSVGPSPAVAKEFLKKTPRAQRKKLALGKMPRV